MKSILSIISLILCFELIVGPIAPQLSLLSQPAWAGQCDDKPGTVWIDGVGCRVPESATSTLRQVDACQDETTEAGRRKCYGDTANRSHQDTSHCQSETDPQKKQECMNNAANSTRADESGAAWLNGANGVMSAAAIFVPMTIAVHSTSKLHSTCASVSFYAMVAGAAALFIGDNLANILHAIELGKIEEEWKTIIKPGHMEEADQDQQRVNATEAQKEAFEMLARSEDSMAATSEMKAWFFGAAGLAFATSAVAAGIEVIASYWPGGRAQSTCPTQKQAKDKADADAKPADAKPADAKPADAKPADAKPADAKPADAKPADAKPADAKPADAKPADAKPADAKPDAGTTPTKPFTKPNGSNLTQMDSNRDVWQPDFYFAEHSWDEDIINYKHLKNIDTAEDVFAFQMLTKAASYDKSSPSVEDYEFYKREAKDYLPESKEVLALMKLVAKTVFTNLNPIAKAQAEEKIVDGILKRDSGSYYTEVIVKAIAGLAAGLSGAFLMTEEIGNYMNMPETRAIFSTVLAGWSFVLMGFNISWMHESRARADKLRDMKDQFGSAAEGIGFCKPEERGNPGKPECYCYTDEGGRNPNRGNSKVCQGLWNGKLKKGRNYLTNGGRTGFCIDQNRQPDQKCACRKSSKGCLKATSKGMAGLNIGNFKMLASGFAPVDQLGNGTFDAAKSSPASMESQALRMKKNFEKLLKHPNAKGLAKSLVKGQKAMSKKLITAGAGVAANLPQSKPIPASPAAAAAALEKEINEKKEEINTASAPSAGGAPEKAPEMDLEFGMTEEDLAVQEAQIAEAMKQDLDYGQNDINNSNANIFELLSNRYHRSGMRRLFDDEGKTKPDAPAKTDITE